MKSLMARSTDTCTFPLSRIPPACTSASLILRQNNTIIMPVVPVTILIQSGTGAVTAIIPPLNIPKGHYMAELLYFNEGKEFIDGSEHFRLVVM